MFVTCLTAALAAAEPDAPADEDSPIPLAIPVGESGPPPQFDGPPDDPRPMAIPGPSASAEEVAARRQYARRHLSVRDTSEIVVSATTMMSPGWGYGWGGWGGWGWGGGWGGWAWTVPTATRVDSWAVLEGTRRLDVPRALDRLGDPGARMELERRVRVRRTWGHVITGVGAAGIAAGVVGLVGLDQARTLDEARAWSAMGTAGLVGGAGALVVGSFPSSRARRLLVDPTLTIDREQAAEQAEVHNEALRVELGLSPTQALAIEQSVQERADRQR